MSAPVHEAILDDMDDGVVAVAADGRILSINAAGARILGLDDSRIEGRLFGEVFVPLDGLEAFTDTILDATGEPLNVGRKAIEIRTGDKRCLLKIGTSRLHSNTGLDGARAGIVAVFSDITEIQELRESELRLGEKIREQYGELQTAYRRIEESNSELSATLRRVQAIKAIAAAVALAIVLGAGYYAWRPGGGPVVAEASAPVDGGAAPVTLVVRPQHLRQAVSFPGRLSPQHRENVVSPVPGTVKALHVGHGDEVVKGQLLVELDISGIVREHRSARAKYIQAVKRAKELEDWENGRDMLNARRTLDRARRALDRQERKIRRTAFLLKSGVIPASEHETALEQHESLQVDHKAAEVALRAVREKGGGAAREVAELELQDARERLRELEAALSYAEVRAPVSGVVLLARQKGLGPAGSSAGTGLPLQGATVSRGQLLLTVANVRSLSVKGVVDEVEVARLRVGQPVTVTGDAFPGVLLPGALSSVSSQAVDGFSQGSTASFEFTAALDRFGPEVRRRLRLGMSVDVEVVTQDVPDALLVPLRAVRGGGAFRSVRVLDPATGEVRSVEVETGATTRDAVHVTRGLSVGDAVVLGDGRDDRGG